MAKRSSGPNKSAAIREYLDKNPEAKPREIVDALKAQGVDVTPAFVSTIKSKSGGAAAPKKRRGRPARAASAPRTQRATSQPAAGRAASANDKVSVDSLIRAKKLAQELGGVDKARAALSALEKITG